MERHKILASILLLIVITTCVVAGRDFMNMWNEDILHPGVGVKRTGRLSDYCSTLDGTRFNSTIYFLESGKPGATMLLLGGTHPNEPAGFMTAVVMIENLHITDGRVIVIPQACLSGFTCTDPLEGYPDHFTIPTANGSRSFRFGSRGANPIDQWPDPLVFLQYPSGQQLSGNETRNLNRSYPGKQDGTPVEQSAYAIMQLLKNENVDIAIDLHEAAPEIPIINALVTHPKGRDLAGAAVLNLEFDGLQYSLEMSPDNFRGLSHREWGDRTNAYAFLMETSNPIQGRLRGITNEELILKGTDVRYWKAAQLGTMRITYDLHGEPLSLRVGRHLQGLREIVVAYNDAHPEKKLTIEHMPTFEEMTTQGIGTFLH